MIIVTWREIGGWGQKLRFLALLNGHYRFVIFNRSFSLRGKNAADENKKMREEEKKRYKEVMHEVKKDDDEFRKRSEADRKKRIAVRIFYFLRQMKMLSIVYHILHFDICVDEDDLFMKS